MRYAHIVALTCVIAMFTLILGCYKPARSAENLSSGDPWMTINEKIQPRVVYPTYYTQASNGTIVEAKTQPLLVKDLYNWKKDPLIIFSIIGGVIVCLLAATIYATREKEDEDLRRIDWDFRHVPEARSHSPRSISEVLKQLPVLEDTLRAEHRAERRRYEPDIQPVQSRHPPNSALGAWGKHIRTVKAERTIAAIRAGTDPVEI